MKLRVLFGTLAVIWLAGVTQFSARAEQSKSVWDGVFTKEQAARGAAQYKTMCSECHGVDLGGDGFAPALSGSDFMGNWTDLSVGDLFERIRISMPPSDPGSGRSTNRWRLQGRAQLADAAAGRFFRIEDGAAAARRA